jgi:hypothetical protein
VTCGHVWTRYKFKICLKNETKRGPKRGVPKGPLFCPKGFEILLREMRLFSHSFSGSQDRLMAQEKSILKIVTFNFESQNVSLDVIKIDVLLRL